MALDEPLPGKANPQLVFLGVVLRTGKEALFGLTGAAILHGSGTCQPSATQCQAIDLQVGQSETLEVVEADGSTVTYELKLVSIDKSTSTASTAARSRCLPRPGQGCARTGAPGAEAVRAALLALGRRLRIRRASGVRRARPRGAPARTLSRQQIS